MVEVEEVLAYKPLSRKNIEQKKKKITASNLEIVAKNLTSNFNFNLFWLSYYFLFNKLFTMVQDVSEIYLEEIIN